MKDEINEDLRRWFKEKWVDISKKDASGKHPPCGRSESKKKGYPKCRPSKKVSSETPETSGEMSPEEKKAATRQKRTAEKKDRKGKKPHMTSHHSLDEMVNESKNHPTDPKLWSRAKSLAKKKFKVYPSAYANGWAAKWYKKHGGGWTKKKEVKEGVSDIAKALAVGTAIAGGIVGGAKMAGVGRFAQPQTQSASQVQAHQEQIPIANVVRQPKTTEKQEEKPANVIHHDTIKTMVKKDEGLRTKCYKCTAGKLTIGYGHNLETPKSKETFRKAFGDQGDALHAHAKGYGEITHEQADALFDADYDEHLSRTKKLIPNLEQHPPDVQAALVSGVYRGHVSDSPTFRKHFNAGDYHAAAKEFLNRKEYTNPKTKKDGSLVAPGVKTRLERDHKILSDYAHSQSPK